MARKIPPTPQQPRRRILQLLKKPLPELARLAREFEDIVKLGRLHILQRPEYIRHVLVDNSENFIKKNKGISVIRQVFHENLLTTTDYEFWKKHRRLESPAFHRLEIFKGDGIVAAAADDMMNAWVSQGEQQRDVADLMMALMLRVNFETLLGVDIGKYDEQRIGAAATLVHAYMGKQMMSPITLPPMFKYKKALGVLQQTVKRVIADHRRDGLARDCLLTTLIRGLESSGAAADDYMVDEILVHLMPAYEASASILALGVHLIASHPSVREKLEEELDASLGGAVPDAEALQRMPYLDCVMEEILRLYSPPLISRTVRADDEIGGYFIPAGAEVLFSPFTIQRDPRYWPNPEQFLPERHDGDAKSHLLMFPFGGGKRICIGNQMARFQMKLVLATIMRKYRLGIAPDFELDLALRVVVKSKHGMPMILAEREACMVQ